MNSYYKAIHKIISGYNSFFNKKCPYIMDLYAAKGSGAIENASRKVIGITGSSDNSDKKVSIFKNSDGDLFDAQLEWTPYFRLKKKKEEVINSRVLNKKFTIVEDS